MVGWIRQANPQMPDDKLIDKLGLVSQQYDRIRNIDVKDIGMNSDVI